MADGLDTIFRREHGRCVATLIRILGDIDVAEDAVAEAFAIAAQRWPTDGIPPNPGAWITSTARNRAIDRLRREATRTDHHLAARQLHSPDMTSDDPDRLGRLDDLATIVADDQLRLIFLCCHPALSADARVALSLRLLGGLEIDEIAAAFVVPESTMAKRLVRAKQKLRHNNAPYRIPTAADLPDRLHVALTVIYLIYTQGHRASSSSALVRDDLTAEAIRLARVVHELMPDEPEAAGLLALLLLTESRAAARWGPSGELVPLSDQDRTRWNRTHIDEGHELVRACLRRNEPGPFQIQAAIAAVHADSSDDERTDWDQILALYDQLAASRPSPIVEINRAVVVARVHGPDAGLAAIDQVETTGRLDAFQPYHAVRADLLRRCVRHDEAAVSYERAISLTNSDSERRFLASRLADIRHPNAQAKQEGLDR